MDAVTAGWATRTTLELAAELASVPFDVGWLEDAEQDEVTRIYLVTWEGSSVLLRFTPVLLTGSCVGTVETQELQSDDTTALLFNVEAGKGELDVFTSWEIVVITVETGETLEPRLRAASVPVILLSSPLR